jgi:hypothetical protein
MRLKRLTFKGSALKRLSEPEQLFLFRLAQARDDLRQLNFLCHAALNGLPPLQGVERRADLHEVFYGIRLICGTLYEVWKIIETGWNGSGLARSFISRLKPEAKISHSYLCKYFNDPDNIVARIRNKFAFHYDADLLKDPIASLESGGEYSFVTGTMNGNVFYDFAEEVRLRAMLREVNDQVEDPNATIAKLADEAYGEVYGHMVTFSDAVLSTIVSDLGVQVGFIEISSEVDMRNQRPVLFVNEAAISELQKSFRKNAESGPGRVT